MYMSWMLERWNWWIVVAAQSARAGFYATVAITSVICSGDVQEYSLLCVTAHMNVGALYVFNVWEDGAAW